MREIEDWTRHDPSGRFAVARVRMTERNRNRRPRPADRVRARLGRWLVRLGQVLADEAEPLALREGLAEPVSRRPAR